jgi:hypothetical protein
MNRAVLVVLVDFLLISLVTLFSANQKLDLGPAQAGPDIGVEVKAVQDMLEVLQQALAQEQLNRGQLSNQLSRVQDQAQTRQQELAEREARLQESERKLRAAELAARQIAEERDRLQTAQVQAQQQLTRLEVQQAEAQNRVQRLQEDLRAATNETSVSRASAEAVATELAARRTEVQRLQEQIASLQTMTFSVQEEKGRLATNLVRVETEAAQFRERLDENRQQIATLAVEKERIQEHATTLAKGIDTLAAESQTLATELRQDRQLAPNAIYKHYLDNRVDSSLRASRPGLLGMRSGDVKVERVILFRDADRVFALFHLQDTPLPGYVGGPNWTELSGTLGRGGATVPLTTLSFVASDPRILVTALDEAAVKALGVEPYGVSEDPAKFQDAVVVGGKEGYYGEVEFKLVPGLPRYLKMQRRQLGKIFGKFSPSKGDLAFSKSGELLGMMVNSQYCSLVRSMPPARLVRLGKDLSEQSTSQIGAEVARRLQALPMSLQ